LSNIITVCKISWLCKFDSTECRCDDKFECLVIEAILTLLKYLMFRKIIKLMITKGFGLMAVKFSAVNDSKRRME